MYRVPARSAHASIGTFRTSAGRARSRNVAEGNGHQVSALDVLGAGPRGKKARIFDILGGHAETHEHATLDYWRELRAHAALPT